MMSKYNCWLDDTKRIAVSPEYQAIDLEFGDNGGSWFTCVRLETIDAKRLIEKMKEAIEIAEKMSYGN